MTTAVLRIETSGGAEARRLIEELATAVASASRRVGRAGREGRQREVRETTESVGRQVGAYRGARVRIEEEERLVTRAKLRELAKQGKAQQDFVTLFADCHKRATAALEAEVGKRATLSEREKQQVHDLALAMVAEHERAERERTASTKREANKRRAAERDLAGRVAGGLRAAGSAVAGAAGSAHGDIQDARERRAQADHTLNGAFYQAGVSGSEAATMRATLAREVSDPSGRLRGLRLEDLASGLFAAQSQFSVLSGDTAEERAGNLNRQIDLMAMARNSYQDPGEVMRVAGMLGQQHVRGDDQRAALMSLTGMAQAGSIELSTLSAAALGPLMQNIARVTNANQTPEQRQTAVRAAVSETMAVGEIGAAAGLTPRDSLNAFAKLRGSVTNPLTAERLRDRLHSEHRDDLARGLIQRDRQGRYSFKDPNAVNLMSSLVQGFGGDANRVTNLLSSGGAGAPMVLDAQQRRLIMAMASQTEGGQTIAQHVSAMQRTGADFGQEDLARGAAMRDDEQLTALTQGREAHDSALTDNTSAVNQLSNAIRDFATRNPLTATGLGAAGSTVGGVAGGALANAAGRAVAAAAGSGAAGSGAAGAAAGVGTAGAAAAATTAAAVAASALAGLAVGGQINRALGHTQQSDNPFDARFYTEFARSVRDAVRDGVTGATVNVAPRSPNDDAHGDMSGRGFHGSSDL